MKQGKGFLGKVLIFIMVMVMSLASTPGVFAYTVEDDGEPVHEYIVQQAMALYDHFYDNPELTNALGTIQSGARHEDVYDHITDRIGICDMFVTLFKILIPGIH